MKNRYLIGTYAIGAISSENRSCVPWWETTAIMVGALSALATLIEVTVRWKKNGGIK